jgi:hypothetical protein
MRPSAAAAPSRALSKPLSVRVLTSERFPLFLLLRLLLLEVVVDILIIVLFEWRQVDRARPYPFPVLCPRNRAGEGGIKILGGRCSVTSVREHGPGR